MAQDRPSPKPLLDKLGIHSGHRVALVGSFPDDFVSQVLVRTNDVVRGARKEGCDHIFLLAEGPRDLPRIESLKDRLKPAGALWIVRAKGPAATIRESESRAAGLGAGLVDVKVVSFSDTHSAEKFVFRLKDRT